eukprot:COSAG01_NODE_70583_length_258_cov_0.647799_1_plen_46_part_10
MLGGRRARRTCAMALGCAALVYTCAVFVAWTLRNNRPGGGLVFFTT